MRSIMRAGWVFLVLAGCSGEGGRHVTNANETAMVVVDEIARDGGRATATVHIVYAQPQVMDDGDRLTEIVYESEFDCQQGLRGDRRATSVLHSGRMLQDVRPDPLVWKRPTPDTLGDGIVKTACDPEYAKSKATLNSLKTLKRRYLKRTAAGEG